MKALTQQKIFNKVAKHLLTQNKKAYQDGGCVMKTKSGLMCAVGCLIPDSMWNDNNATMVGQSDKWKEYVGFSKNWGLLGALQSVHDGYKPSQWFKQLSIVAKGRKLRTTELNKFKK